MDWVAPFETAHGNRLFPTEAGAQQTMSELLQDAARTLTNACLGMCCFSDDPLRENLWIDYAGAGGLCVKIDSGLVVHDLAKDRTGRFALRQVQYPDQARPIRMNASKTEQSSDALNSFFEKEPRWKDESEWRLLRSEFQELRQLTEHERRIVMPPGGVAGVYLGWGISPKNELRVTGWCKPLQIPMFRIKKDASSGVITANDVMLSTRAFHLSKRLSRRSATERGN